jgi:hypothetical protein
VQPGDYEPIVRTGHEGPVSARWNAPQPEAGGAPRRLDRIDPVYAMAPNPVPYRAMPRPKSHPVRTALILVLSAALFLTLPVMTVIWSRPAKPDHPVTLPKLPQPTDMSRAGDTSQTRASFMSWQINTFLKAQEHALTVKDEAEFIKAGGNPAATAALRLRYENLIAMHVSAYHQTITNPAPSEEVVAQWSTTVSIQYCFGDSLCGLEKVDEPTVWEDTGDGAALLSVGLSKSGEWDQQPQPWEQTPLVAAVGERVVVAAPASLKGRLQTVLQEAEKAVPVADSFGVPRPQDFYRIYIADAKAWQLWYHMHPSSWMTAYAFPIGMQHADVVLNSATTPDSALPDIMRRELTQASATYGSHAYRKWWEIEGYSALAEPPMSAAQRTAARNYIRTWNGQLPYDPPPANASAATVANMRAVSYAAMAYLQKKYGLPALKQFMADTVRLDGDGYTFGPRDFHTDWATVVAEMVKAVRAF